MIAIISQRRRSGLWIHATNRQEPPVRIPARLAIAILLLAAGPATAQHHGHGPQAAPADSRALVRIPPIMTTHMLANMRDHLLALQEIQDALGRDDTAQAAKIAEQRLGMSSLSLHGAHDIAPYMPKAMQDSGTAMHRAASRFAIVAQDAGVTGDVRSAVAALATITAQCVGCHAGYRVK
jgi:hypothetical protein